MDLEPPYDLTLPARKHWDRLAAEIYGAGRWNLISKDLLAQFCQVLTLVQQCMSGILADGVLVSSSRTERDKVRHPLLTPLSQSEALLVKLAKSIPLNDPKMVDRSGASVDALISELMK